MTIVMNILFISDYSEIEPALHLPTKDRDHLLRVYEYHVACGHLYGILNKRGSQHLVLRKAVFISLHKHRDTKRITYIMSVIMDDSTFFLHLK